MDGILVQFTSIAIFFSLLWRLNFITQAQINFKTTTVGNAASRDKIRLVSQCFQ